MNLVTYTLAERLGTTLLQLNAMCVTAESCTGGGIAKAITEIPGSSQWFERAFITYSNRAKHEMLGVPEAMLSEVGAVSKEVVCAMATGALEKSPADYSVAISGIAGPDGGSPLKPVGLVWMAWAARTTGVLAARSFIFSGDRHAIREQAIEQALSEWLDLLPQHH
ncbi:MAG: nicotinamide-nucleotide amidohydrolase family protein [Gammaproteobacteria bacterium]|nr:nicotinamide-nucleotide amidohydrolase family protein [Gammaproteobacteria bacterium]